MNTHLVEKFNIIGIAVRTTNENGQSAQDIPQLWQTFFAENTIARIPNKIDSSIYCMYTDYEKDHTKPYTTILGCAVENLTHIPENMVGKTVERANYIKRVVKGNLADGIVFKEWLTIWDSDLPRSFTSDFEIYGEKAQDSE
ncbi:MAG: AraC family transcriptional regulator, partial [Chitinophagaceae bacterium]